MADEMPRAYVFEGNRYTSLSHLANAMGAAWLQGKNVLFNGNLPNFFMPFDRSLGQRCLAAVREQRAAPNLSDYIFAKWLVRIPGIKGIFWRGRYYGDKRLLPTNLRSTGAQELQTLVTSLVKDQMFSSFAENCGMSPDICGRIRYVERSAIKDNSMFSKKNICPLIASILEEPKLFRFDGRDFLNPKQLGDYLQPIGENSREQLEIKVKKLYADEYNLNPVFEAWLLTLGNEPALSLWKERFQKGKQTEDDDLPYLEDAEERKEAQEQELETFSDDIFEFENSFLGLLQQHLDALDDPGRFNGLMKDYFPTKTLQCFLILTLYKMDIVKSIREAKTINELFASRFIKRMVADFGMREEFARWAVSVWCFCFGEKILGKNNTIAIYKILQA